MPAGLANRQTEERLGTRGVVVPGVRPGSTVTEIVRIGSFRQNPLLCVPAGGESPPAGFGDRPGRVFAHSLRRVPSVLKTSARLSADKQKEW